MISIFLCFSNDICDIFAYSQVLKKGKPGVSEPSHRGQSILLFLIQGFLLMLSSSLFLLSDLRQSYVHLKA